MATELRVHVILTDAEARVIMEALEEKAERLRSLSEDPDTTSEDHVRALTWGAELLEGLASHVNNERISAGA